MFSRLETIKVALVLCLVCSIAVSTAAVVLKPFQERNKAQAVRADILSAAGLLPKGPARKNTDIDALFEERITSRLVDLETGEYAEGMDASDFDQQAAVRDPQTSVPIPQNEDIASIRRRAKYAPVYLVGDPKDPDLIVVPVYGYGLWSTMYAMVALGGEASEIEGVRFYAHGETAGLGAEIENPRWQDQWVGKKVFDESGNVAFELAKGGVDPDAPDAGYRVDGLAGATLTANGVTNMMRYWMGEQGFGPYLARFR